MPRAPALPRAKRAWLQDLSLLFVLRALATMVALSLGFSAVSDDDFARITIAQSFAVSPSLDPSGSSWLPFPFWVNGTAMWIFGRSVEVARGAALVLSFGALALTYVSARWLLLPRAAALLGGAVVAVLPHAVWLGYATVPEGYTAALGLFALATLHGGLRNPHKTLLGALALVAATLSRYESWAIAAYFAAYCVYQALRQRKFHWGFLACLALLGPCLWLTHGLLRYDDPFFFVQRVAEYRQALGRSATSWWSVLSNYPWVLLRAEPELVGLFFLTLARRRNIRLTAHAVPVAFGLSALFLLLLVGDIRDGAPTHHAERPLLTIWLAFALLVGSEIARAWQAHRPYLFYYGAIAGLLFALRPVVTRRDAFIDRSAELEIGRLAKRYATRGLVLIDSEDFGFFATIAGFESPERSRPLDAHDPRYPQVNPWTSPEILRNVLDNAQAEWLVARNSKLHSASGLGPIVAQSRNFSLVDLQPQPSSRHSPAAAASAH